MKKTKKFLTRQQWKKRQRTYKIISIVLALVGLFIFGRSFLTAPTAEFNGPTFGVGLVILVAGIVALVVISDQSYKDYLKDAQQ